MKRPTLFSSTALSIIIFFFFIVNSFAQGAGNCLDFDGSNDYVEGSGISTSLSNLTLECWVYHRTLPSIIHRYVRINSEVAVIRHDGVNQQGQLHFYLKTDGTFRHIRVNNILETGKWYHIAGTWDGTDMKLYLNGELAGESTPGGTLDTPDGNITLSHVTTTLDGYLDDVRIWNDARTLTEIRENMNKSLSGSESGLEHYWKLDESSGTIANDAAGSVDLNLYNMTDGDWVRSSASIDVDFGDAPLPYSSLFTDNGAHHHAIEATLGSERDLDSYGYQSTNADGDDNDGIDDEDGVSDWTNVQVGKLDASVTVNVQGSTAKLDAWIDWNLDGSWGGPFEHIANDMTVNTGDNIIFFDVPNWANAGNSYARFRLSTDGDLSMSGLANDGEVEDYQLSISSPALGTNAFVSTTISSSANGAQSVFTADIDGDGDMDILSASVSDDKIAWYENDGSENFAGHTISNSANGARSVFTADVEGDGDMDVLSASFDDDKIAWYENDGSENFTAYTITTSANGATSVIAADVDADGDMDVLSASYNDDKIVWYENDGSENFITHIITTSADKASSVFAVDVNGDGNMDILSASSVSGANILWYENDGSENFVSHTINSSIGGVRSVFAADVNGDGIMDVLSASSSDGKIVWYENDGSENFTAHTISSSANGARSVFATDVDGDGNMDVLSASYIDDKIAWYENDGNENFTVHTISSSANGASSVFAADIDGDGDMDILSASATDDKIRWYEQGEIDLGDAPVPYPTLLLENGTRHILSGPILGATRDGENDAYQSNNADGDDNNGIDDEDGISGWTNIRVGKLGASVTVNVQGEPAKIDAWMDWNRDGSWGGPLEHVADNVDVTVGDNILTFDVPSWADAGNSYARFRLSTTGDLSISGLADDGEVEDYQFSINSPGSGNGDFISLTINNSMENAINVIAADLDGDSDMDIIGVSHNDQAVWFENNSSESFTPHFLAIDHPRSVFAADVNGDGKMDVLSASYLDDKIAWCKNNGNGYFSSNITISIDANGASSVFAADVNGDGNMDVLSASIIDDKIAWYENDGSENFTAHDITTSANGASSVFAADVDGDGDMDVLSASINDDKIAWYENDGYENFTTHTITTSANSAESVFAADVDGDGDMDVLSASINDDKITWYENDGSGNFIVHVITTSANGAESVFAADVDGDGDMDILSASRNDDKITWYENDGYESFTIHTITTSADGARSVFAADIDGDGDMDVLSASYNDNKIAWYEQEGNPIVLTSNITDITGNSAKCGGNVTDLGQPVITARGVCWNTNVDPIISDSYTSNGEGLGSFISSITGLNMYETYYVRAYATNSEGTVYGAQKVFVTPLITPGYTLKFDGANDYVGIPDDNSLDLTTDYSIEAWIKPSSFGSLEGIVSKYQSSGDNGFTLRLTNNSPYSGINFDGVYTSNGVLNANEWMHVAAVNDNGNRKIYLNGIEQTISGSAIVVESNSSPIRIASDYGGRYFNGKIDEVRIWNAVRSQAEIRDNMNKILIGDEANLTAYYRFDHNSGTLLDDLSPNNNDGTLNNMANDNWKISAASVGDESQLGTGTDNIYENTEVTVDINWDGDDAGVDAIFSAIQVNDVPGVITGLSDDYFSTYWELWIANDDGSFKSDVNFHYDGMGIDDESTLKLFTRSDPLQSWTQVSDITINDENNNIDGDGYITANNLTNWSQFIITKGKIPSVNTTNITDITKTTAKCGGEVINEGYSSVSSKGIVWGTSENPTLDIHIGKTSDGSGVGSFTSYIEITEGEQNFFVRAYATNTEGTAYGTQRIFTTPITPPGNTLEFDGVDDYVNIGNDANFNFGNTFTIEAWIKPTNLSGRYGIFSTRLNNDPNSFQLEVGNGDGGTNRIAVTAPNTWVVQTNDNVIALNKWNHIAYTRNGTGSTHTIYVNGVAQSLVSNVDYTYSDNDSDKVIGGGASGGNLFIGQIDEMRWWNEPRTETEIQDNMNKILIGNEANLIAYYRFDRKSGIYLDDFSTNTNIGVLKNMTDDDWIISTASVGDESHVGTGVGNLTQNTDVSVAINWDGDDPGSDAIYAAIQVNEEPDINTGLPSNYPYTYWELWIANDDGSFQSDVNFHYNSLGVCEESTLELYTRANPGQSWTQVSDFTIFNEGDNTDGDGYITANNLLSWSQFIITGDCVNQFTPPGNTLKFDGEDDYVNIGNDANFNFGNIFTIEAWIKPANLSGRYGIFSTRLNNDPNSFQLEVGNGDGGTNNIAVTAPGSWVVQTIDNVINPNEWNHIAYTRNGTGSTHTIYVNGVAQSLISNVDYTFNDNSSDKVIGSGASGGELFAGQIDEMRVWSVARTETEIQESMNKTINGIETNLISYYRFDHNSGINLVDFSDNTNNGTLNNMTNYDWVISTASVGHESHVGIGTGDLTENGDVSVDINWDGDDPGSDAIFAAIQVNEKPDILVGLYNGHSNTYWELWIANDDGSFQSDVKFHYDDIEEISNENTLELYTRSDPGQNWTQVSNVTLVYEGSSTDGVGYIVANNLSTWGQFIISGEGIGFIATANVTDITNTTVNCGGNITDLGQPPITSKGVCWNTSGDPTISDSYTSNGEGLGSFTSSITGLISDGHTYYVRAYATNSEGTFYGSQKVFVTPMANPGNALNFDGVNDYVNIGNKESLDLGNTLSIEAWVKPDNLTSRYGVFSTRFNNNANAFQLEIGTGTNRVAVTAPTTWVAQTDDNVFSPNEWTHITYTRNGTGATHKIYINGVEQTLISNADYLFIDNNNDKVIGSGTSGGQLFPGEIDEVRIWNVVRTETEVRNNMHKILNGDETGLIGYYRSDHISGTALDDLTINNNDGTLINMDNSDWIESTAPVPFTTAANGTWENDNTWATGQNSPIKAWSRVKVKHVISLNTNIELIEIKFEPNAEMIIAIGKTLSVKGE